MKKTLCVMLFIAVFISAAVMINKAHATYEAVVNGGFETGNFNGWSMGGFQAFREEYSPLPQ
jgi:hypothetical protein